MSDQSPATPQIGPQTSPSTSQPCASVYPTPPISQATSEASSPSSPQDIHYFLNEGLEDALRRRFKDNGSFSGAVESQRKEMRAGKGRQYMVFSPVSEAQLAKIEELRDEDYKSIRFMYLTQPQTLIAKVMLSKIHGVTMNEFCRMLWEKAASIGKGLDRDLMDIGGTTFGGKFTSKEADAAFQPRSSRPGKASWPTLVVECGKSEAIRRLRVDAKWWLLNSAGQVNIVLVFSINEESKQIIVEQWEMAPHEDPADTSSHSEDATMVPKCISTFTVTPVGHQALEPTAVALAGSIDLDAATSANPPEIAVAAPTNASEPAAAALDNPPKLAAVAPTDPPKPKILPEGLRLGFEKVFARKPRKGSAERNLMFTPLELSDWWNEIWPFVE